MSKTTTIIPIYQPHLDHNMKIETNNNTKIIIQLNYPNF